MNVGKTLGPAFPAEFMAAGLGGCEIMWSDDGEVRYNGATPEQISTFAAVVAAHDPTKPAPPITPQPVDPGVAEQARAALAALGLTEEQIDALIAKAASTHTTT